MTKTRHTRFWRNWELLFSAFEEDIDRPIRVELRQLKGSPGTRAPHGFSELTSAGEYLIVVNENKTYLAWVDTLRHELAHVLDWTHSERQGLDDHGESWGVQYSRVYQECEAW